MNRGVGFVKLGESAFLHRQIALDVSMSRHRTFVAQRDSVIMLMSTLACSRCITVVW